MRARPELAALRGSLLLICQALALPGLAEGSCQTPICHESMARWQLDSLREQEAEVMHSSDPAVWSRFLEDLRREASNQRAVAQYEAKFRWENPLLLDRPEEAAARQKERVAVWTERWRAKFPGRAEPWCEPAKSAPDLEAALAILSDGERAGADPEALEECRLLVRTWRGQRDEVVAELSAAIERDPGNLWLHNRLVQCLGYGSRTAARDRAIQRRAAAFPEDVEAQAAELNRLVEGRRIDEAVDLLARTRDLPWPPRERHRACTIRGLPSRTRLTCLELVLGELDEGDTSPDALYFRNGLHDAIRAAAIETGDARRAIAAIEAMTSEKRTSAWVAALGGGTPPPELCSAARSFLRERGAQPAPAQLYEFRQHLALVQRMELCGSGDDVRAALAALDPGGTGDPVATRIARISLHAEQTIPHTASGPSADRRAEMAMEHAALERRIPYFLERAAADPTRARPAVVLARAYDLSGELGESERWYEETIRRDPASEPDLRIRKVELYLRHGAVEKARQEAQGVQRMAAAFARHRAEADYFLGRIARERGDLEEATDRFEAYFTLRHRYELCATCDRPLLLQLFELGDPGRLRRYLDARSDAIELFEQQLSYCRIGPNSIPRNCPSKSTSPELEAATAGGCRLATTEAHLDSLTSQPNGPTPDLARRIQLVAGQPPCPAAWNHSASWFRDDQVLRVYGELTRVD